LDAKASTRLTQIPWKCWEASRLVRIWRRNPFAWLLKISIYTIVIIFDVELQNLITYKNLIKHGWQMYVGGDKDWNQMMVWIISMLHASSHKNNECKKQNHSTIFIVKFHHKPRLCCALCMVSSNFKTATFWNQNNRFMRRRTMIKWIFCLEFDNIYFQSKKIKQPN
jgi:hypothetical protein